MLMEKKRQFLNFEVDDEIMAKVDETAKASGWDRSKQARALLMYALGIEWKPPRPYIPIQRGERLPFEEPIHETPGPKSRRRRRPRE